jgi:hypothetical protein
MLFVPRIHSGAQVGGADRAGGVTRDADAPEANAWVVGDDEEVIVVDPGRDAEAVLGAVGDRPSQRLWRNKSLALVFRPVHPWCALLGLGCAVLRMRASRVEQVPKVPDLVAHLMEPFGQGCEV